MQHLRFLSGSLAGLIVLLLISTMLSSALAGVVETVRWPRFEISIDVSDEVFHSACVILSQKNQ